MRSSARSTCRRRAWFLRRNSSAICCERMASCRVSRPIARSGSTGLVSSTSAAIAVASSVRSASRTTRKRSTPDDSNPPYQRPESRRSRFGRASFTLSARPSNSMPFNAAMALSACESSDISTNANPRERPVSRSVIKATDSTAPCSSKRERMVSSVVANARFPTKIFFT